MGCYVLAIGGTGNKILESIVYAAAADAFYTVTPEGKQISPESQQALDWLNRKF